MARKNVYDNRRAISRKVRDVENLSCNFPTLEIPSSTMKTSDKKNIRSSL